MRLERPERRGATSGPVWFVGDLDDPWVVAIADALPVAAHARRIGCPGELPDDLFDDPDPPAILLLHRASLTRADAQRLARLRASRTPPPRVVLCVGPHVRHVDLERWGTLVDAVVPEATARETIARHLAAIAPEALVGRVCRSPVVTVVSTSSALRLTLAEAVSAAGYRVSLARDWLDASPTGPALWDVPVLEPGWPEALAERAHGGPVLALLGFADRALVAQARSHGATACLELPFDLADLVLVLDRLVPAPAPAPAPVQPVARRREPAHPTPPAPVSSRAPVAERSGRVAGSEREA